MQTLYTRKSGEQTMLKAGEADKLLQTKFKQTYGLLAFQLQVLTGAARYAERDSRLRGAKHLPSNDDLNVAVKLAGNELLWRILESDFYKDAMTHTKGHDEAVTELSRKVYQRLCDTSEYYLYNQEEGRSKQGEKAIMEFIYNDLMLANDIFTDTAEGLYPNWDDDAEMLQQIVMAYLQKPGVYRFDDLLTDDKRNYAAELMQTVAEKHDHLSALIKPKLKNWDADRLALLDTILLEMGLAEFLYFETIPPKVTINEYIDIAKAYSTAQSGQFVNGILDSLRIELEKENKMIKTDFRKSAKS